LTGCLANRKDVQRRLKNKVDLFTDIKDFQENFEKFLYCHPEFISGSQEMLKQVQHDINYLSISPNHTNKFTAYIPIMTGCNNFCSYCVVPYARGKEISRLADEILKEIKGLVKKGYKEIILLGQNVNSYKSQSALSPSPLGRGCPDEIGTDEGKSINFSQLLRRINNIPGNFWISFVSNHPKDFSDELIETSTKLKKVCEYIHLPIQAGDDKVLEKMNRKYTAKYYLNLIKKIKANFKKNKSKKLYSITSDIIVGFPGETKKQFLQSAEIMQKVKYDMVYFGQYSPRPGTAAWKLKDNVPKKEKGRREQYLNEILKKTSFANNKKYVGKVLEVLVDKELSPFSKGRAGEGFLSKSKTKIPLYPPFTKGETIYFGRTRTMKNVKIISDKKDLLGKIVKTKIIKANVWNLEGTCQPKAGPCLPAGRRLGRRIWKENKKCLKKIITKREAFLLLFVVSIH
jgi:tRNA-2-methylthio-N6-dimethylallyladenosine synthase